MSAALSQSSTELLDLRHFQGSDLRNLMENETNRWLHSMSWDYSGSAEMILRYLDARILPGYAALRGRRVVGYSFFVYEGSKGVIGDLFVDPHDPESDQLEQQLALNSLETLQRSPGIHRIEAQLLLHDRDRLVPTFQQFQSKRHVRLFLELDLAQDFGPASTPDGFVIRRWTEEDFHPAGQVITRAYRGHVDAEINDQYRSHNGAMRFLNNIVRFPGCGTFDSDSSFVAVHPATGHMAGLILCSRINEQVGHVTQICLLPAHRGYHLGEALMQCAIRNLQQRRFTALSLTVTEANMNAVRLYKKLGFQQRRAFDAFVWEG